MSRHTFHKDTTTISDGIIMLTNSRNSLVVEIKTSGTAKVVFEGMGELGTWKPLVGISLNNNLSISTETSDFSCFYQFDLFGYDSIRMRISENSGNPTTIVGRVG